MSISFPVTGYYKAGRKAMGIIAGRWSGRLLNKIYILRLVSIDLTVEREGADLDFGGNSRERGKNIQGNIGCMNKFHGRKQRKERGII
jgi:hypothetical protein